MAWLNAEPSGYPFDSDFGQLQTKCKMMKNRMEARNGIEPMSAALQAAA
jgi:hypothetical protein